MVGSITASQSGDKDRKEVIMIWHIVAGLIVGYGVAVVVHVVVDRNVVRYSKVVGSDVECETNYKAPDVSGEHYCTKEEKTSTWV